MVVDQPLFAKPELATALRQGWNHKGCDFNFYGMWGIVVGKSGLRLDSGGWPFLDKTLWLATFWRSLCWWPPPSCFSMPLSIIGGEEKGWGSTNHGWPWSEGATHWWLASMVDNLSGHPQGWRIGFPLAPHPMGKNTSLDQSMLTSPN